MNELHKKVSALVQEAYEKGKRQGLYEGKLLAESIHRLWSGNTELATPFDKKTLDDWTVREIEVRSTYTN